VKIEITLSDEDNELLKRNMLLNGLACGIAMRGAVKEYTTVRSAVKTKRDAEYLKGRVEEKRIWPPKIRQT
tara:strand:+ start:1393 stop:1605 length:213 start_codon:yes stop_codon:yes gene_type:complete